jgi:hypothetical protein
MTEPDRKPMTFLSLSRELRQKILDLTITKKEFWQDGVFNDALQKYDNNIMGLILSHTCGTRTFSSTEPNWSCYLDEEAFKNWHAAYQELKAYGIIPVHVTNHAETLALVHPLVKEDMAWVLKKWLGELFSWMSDWQSAPKRRYRQQSIYVLEPFGGSRRLDKFTPHGFRSLKAIRIGFRKALKKSKEEWGINA